MIREFATRDDLMAAVARRLATALEEAIARRGAACAALSGGTTPEPAYHLLASKALTWSKVTFALVDERFVRPSDPASNEGLVRRCLAPALMRGASLATMWSDTQSATEAATHADALYTSLNIDVALMGMGEDGHTASWFPGADGLASALSLGNARSVVTINAPQAAGATARLTLTRTALFRARDVVLLITGPAKRATLDAALADPANAPPIAALFADRAKRPEVLWAP